MHKPGERVGAILGSKDGVVEFLGYGVYEGDLDRNDPTNAPLPVGFTALLGRRAGMSLNPRIKLDSGKIVWGCECWWGAEEKIKEAIAGHTVVEVDIDKVRSTFLRRQTDKK
jgi:hypothetical protein